MILQFLGDGDSKDVWNRENHCVSVLMLLIKKMFL